MDKRTNIQYTKNSSYDIDLQLAGLLTKSTLNYNLVSATHGKSTKLETYKEKDS
jgi:hypothetical protein